MNLVGEAVIARAEIPGIPSALVLSNKDEVIFG
jgi:hypothetical protein